MGKVIYVSPADDQWKVYWQGEEGGQLFASKEAAIKQARKMIVLLPEGEVSQMRVQRPNGSFQVVWAYGSDPYPPKS